jgi:hypothetical protein
MGQGKIVRLAESRVVVGVENSLRTKENESRDTFYEEETAAGTEQTMRRDEIDMCKLWRTKQCEFQ